MPAFADPFTGMTPGRKMTLDELVRALRLDMAGAESDISTYMAQADATDNVLAKKVLVTLADEERVHAGEFLHLIQILTKNEDELLAKGAAAVSEMEKAI